MQKHQKGFDKKFNISRIHYDGNGHSNDLNIKEGHLVFTLVMRL